MSSKYIYTFVKSNRKNILSAIKSSLFDTSINSNPNDYNDSQSYSDSPSENDYEIIKFNVTLSVEE